MDFSFNDEQQMLLDTTRRFIAERYGFEHRNQVRASAEGWSREVWTQLAELGLLAINIPEDEGGIGAGSVGTMLVGNAIGEGMLLEPFWSSAVVATHALVRLGSPDQRATWLPALAGGETIAVLAHDEASTRFEAMNIDTRATASGDGGYDAFMRALRSLESTLKFKIPKLIDYAVRIPPGGKTDALVETTITWEGGLKTRGVNSDQLVAAIMATSHAINIFATQSQREQKIPARAVRV